MITLKARAVNLLARREYSRLMLYRKLCLYCDNPDEINAVLDVLQDKCLLSDQRFAQSFIHRRASRLGITRIQQELRQQGVELVQCSAMCDALRVTEYERAQQVWHKRFKGEMPTDAVIFAKQARFLEGRGFGHEVIHKILKLNS